MSESNFMELVGSSGPWALAFAYAFQLIVRAWMEDRKRLDQVLDRFHENLTALGSTLIGLRQAIDGLTERLDALEDALDRRGSAERRIA